MLRFDDRVAIVTGAGGNPGLGRAHAMLLASRGAKVVVNDLTAPVAFGKGAAQAPRAEAVVKEILDLGGEAVADTHSVADAAGAEALVETALHAYGRIDILINNAGVGIFAEVDKLSLEDLELTIKVNTLGPLHTTRAVWPHFVSQRYGRIVNTSSAGIHGSIAMTAYGASKGAVWALTRSTAAEGAEFNILCNSIGPAGWGGMSEANMREDLATMMSQDHNQRAELVSPAVALLAHERCPVNGEHINTGMGRVSRSYLMETAGITDLSLTIESVLERWNEVMDAAEATLVPVGAFDPRVALKSYQASPPVD